jgi:hypothetical protein
MADLDRVLVSLDVRLDEDFLRHGKTPLVHALREQVGGMPFGIDARPAPPDADAAAAPHRLHNTLKH